MDQKIYTNKWSSSFLDDSLKSSSGMRISRMIFVSTAFVMPACLLQQIVAPLTFEMFQFSYPFIEGRFRDDFADHQQASFFLKPHILPWMDVQPFPDLFGNGDLPLGRYPCVYPYAGCKEYEALCQ
jgi:hypothetical protein